MKPLPRLLAFLLPLLLLLSLVAPAAAVEIIEDDTIAQGEVIADDAIMSGQVVTMDGTVEGLFVASGARVIINGTVEGDVIVNATKITINGTVLGNVFAAGQSIVINGQVDGSVAAAGAVLRFGPAATVARNVYAAAFSVETEPGMHITRDLAVGAYQLLHAGTVARNLYVGAEALEIDGTVGGDVQADVGSPNKAEPFFLGMPWADDLERVADGGLRVSEEAVIEGDLRYSSPVDQAAGIQNQPGGEVVYTYKAPDNTDHTPPSVAEAVSFWVLDRVRELITLLLLGALALWQMPALLNHLAATAQAKPGPALGWGFVTLVGGFCLAGLAVVGVILAAIMLGVITLGQLAQTVLGIGLGTVGLSWSLFLFAVSYGSKLVVVWAVGQWLWRKLSPNAPNLVVALALGVVLYVLLSGIPVLGFFFVWLPVTLIGLGAMWLAFRDWRAARQAPPASNALA